MKTNPNFRRQLIAQKPGSRLFARFLFTLVACMCFSMLPTLSFGQATTGWILQKQEGNVKAFAKIDQCTKEPGQTFFVKFENTSSTENYEINYVFSVPSNPTFPPITGKITVNAGGSEEGNCTQPPLQGLRMPTPHGSYSLNDLIITYTLTNK